MVKDRIKVFKRLPVSQLEDHPLNWRVHGQRQRAALAELMDRIGFAGACLVREIGPDRYQIIDGHLRKELAGDGDTVPCLITDLTDDEAKKLLLTYDPIAEMADIDQEILRQLVDGIEVDMEAMEIIVGDLMKDVGPVPDDSDGIYEGAGAGAEATPTSDVRMVQLFMDSGTFDVFQGNVEILREEFAVDTGSDAVIRAVADAASSIAKTA